MEAKSVITFPSGEMNLPGPGFYEITGLSWSGLGKIIRVEISTDGGNSWSLAALQDPVLPISQTRFRFPWIWNGTPVVGRAALDNARDWDRSEQRFAQCLAVMPGDGPATVFRRRCEFLRGKTLPPDWDGVWQLTDK
jgi:hypothetical protein